MSLPYYFTTPVVVDYDSTPTRVLIMNTFPLILVGALCLPSRFLWKRFHSTDTLPAEDNALEPLPSFAAGNRAGGDCVVCISTFEPQDQLSLMPRCGHAFHADCINAWIVINPTCPVCRSRVVASPEAMVVDSNRSSNNNMRVEINSNDMDSGTGSSPRSEPVIAPEDLETYRAGDEIMEFLSDV